jgi:hypothetical protein
LVAAVAVVDQQVLVEELVVLAWSYFVLWILRHQPQVAQQLPQMPVTTFINSLHLAQSRFNAVWLTR